MKVLNKKSGLVTFTDHKLLRACLETRLEDETMEIVEEGEREDQGKVIEREIIEKITNKRLNTVSEDEDLVIEWLANTEARTSYREYVIGKYGKELLR